VHVNIVVNTLEARKETGRNDAHERQLLQNVIQGNQEAFRELYCLYQRPLARFVARIVPGHNMIEEVVNDTFCIVWRSARKFRGGSLLSTWIMAIAYRRALRLLRFHDKLTRSDSGPPDGEAISNGSTAGIEVQDWLGSGLRELPPLQRTTLELAYYQGHSCEEIGEIMGCLPATVKGRMFRARLKLSTVLPVLAGTAPKQFVRPCDDEAAEQAELRSRFSKLGRGVKRLRRGHGP
jgi:RNA polymerase sigma-70 factor (ECF subfamily)